MKDNSPSPTEQRIYQLMREYKTNKEIAEIIHVSSNTVGGYVARIYKRHGVCGRVEFLRLFREKIG